jgi:transcriptional regulator with XRE-family HTH domain
MIKIENKEFFIKLGKKIAEQRKELNITQAELAKKLGVQQQVIASYEIGRRRLPIPMLINLAAALYTDVESLLPIEQKPKKRGPTSRLQREIERIQELPESKQKMLLDLIDKVLVAYKNTDNK